MIGAHGQLKRVTTRTQVCFNGVILVIIYTDNIETIHFTNLIFSKIDRMIERSAYTHS